MRNSRGVNQDTRNADRPIIASLNTLPEPDSRNSLGLPHPDGGTAPPGAVNDAASSTHRHQAAVKRTTGQRDGAGAGGLPPHFFWPGAFKSFGAALFVPIP